MRDVVHKALLGGGQKPPRKCRLAFAIQVSILSSSVAGTAAVSPAASTDAVVLSKLVQLRKMDEQTRTTEKSRRESGKAVITSPAAPTAMTIQREVICLETGWTIMQRGITKLKNLLEGAPEQQFIADDCSVLYTTIHNMCSQSSPCNYAKQLYDSYTKSLEDYINSKVLPALREKREEFMLNELVKRWDNHKVMVRWLSRIFTSLDPYLILKKGLPTLSEVGFVTFRDLVLAELKVNVKDAVTVLVARYCRGEQIELALLKNVLGIFVEIGVRTMDKCETDFETFMLQVAVDYYSIKAAMFIILKTEFETYMFEYIVDHYSSKAASSSSSPNFMDKAEQCLTKAKERVGPFLRATSEQKLLEIVEHEQELLEIDMHKALTQYETQVQEKDHSCCDALFRDVKVDGLLWMCRLFWRIPNGLERTASIFRQHVLDEGTALVKQAEDAAHSRMVKKIDGGGGLGEEDFVQKLIELHDKYLQYLSDCSMNHSLFLKSFREAFEVFCNKGVAASNIAELLATFCDILLKKGGSGKLSDGAIEGLLEKVVKLLAYVSNKDLFVEFHRKKLAQRLFEKNANYDHERSLLTKLKQEWGGQFISKMEGMVMDMALTSKNEEQFEEYLTKSAVSNLGMDFKVTILSSGFWPSYESSNLVLPIEMVKCLEVFKEFYGTRTKNRKLTWIYSLGSCNMTGRFDLKPIELIVTTYQAAVLLLFNVEEKLSYNNIKSQLNLTDEDVVRLLHSLSCAKFKILKKDPSTMVVGQSDTFEFNNKFTNKMRQIKIPLPPMNEKKKIIKDVVKDRRYAIDASIVRIMKSRKQMTHQQLMTECVEQCVRLFKLDVKLIKKRVEDLMTRGYLERDIDNPSTYNYVA